MSPYQLGGYVVKKPNRVSEVDLTDSALSVIRDQPKGEITTTKLIAELRKVMKLGPEDEEILEGRHDDHFSQIVRNIKSHKATPGNLIAEGYLVSIRSGFRITEAGLIRLKNKGL